VRALVVYESMYGNTHVVADRIAAGLVPSFEVSVVPVGLVTDDVLATTDLLVVGGPTHVHTMSSTRSRQAAVEAAVKDESLEMDPDAEGPGLRDWFDGLPKERRTARPLAAAFDTRIDANPHLTGRASKGIAKRLRRHGWHLAVGPESFLVDKHSHLVEGEAERAEGWAQVVATAAAEQLGSVPAG
jgi:hypothetical protein